MVEPFETVWRELPADARSAAQARRFLAELLGDAPEEPAAETASLIASELVANAVLHAESVVQVGVRRQDRLVRVEVVDRSPALPERRAPDEEQTTGRGLEMVELLADRWGVDRVWQGKAVWFELAADAGAAGEGAATPEEGATTAGVAEPAVPPISVAVRLPQAPVQLMSTVQQHTEALLRELTLCAIDGEPGAPSASPGVDFGELDRQLRAALQAGHTAADLVLEVPANSAAEVSAADETLVRGDHLAAEGWLLCPPALPEVADCRRWMLEQIAGQLDGGAPEPWQPGAAATTERRSRLDHAAVLDALSTAVLVAGEANRIVYANDAAGELLGWPADELVDRRVTAVIPERLHHAHVAGYTRYMLTGEARLVGTPVHVPARRRDGSEIEVELRLSGMRDEAGRQLVAAALHPQPAGEAPAAEPAESDRGPLAARLRETVAGAAERDERRQAALASLLDEFGWQFAAWWAVDADALACVAVAEVSAELAPFAAATVEHRFAAGVGLPGRVWGWQTPAWLTDVTHDANFPRAAVALTVGLRSGCAAPVVADGEIVGVIELLTTAVQPRDEGVLAALAAAGRVLGEAV